MPKVEVTFKDVEKTVIEKEKQITLNLSFEEALTVLCMLGKLGGNLGYPFGDTRALYRQLYCVLEVQMEDFEQEYWGHWGEKRIADEFTVLRNHSENEE